MLFCLHVVTVVSDYKQRLEKSLKTEKAEHQQSKSELAKISDEKNKNEKTAIDAKVQLSSLQQHYNLLQTQHDDFKQKCSETQQDQLNEMKKLQLKLKELEQELEKVETERENLKVIYYIPRELIFLFNITILCYSYLFYVCLASFVHIEAIANSHFNVNSELRIN